MNATPLHCLFNDFLLFRSYVKIKSKVLVCPLSGVALEACTRIYRIAKPRQKSELDMLVKDKSLTKPLAECCLPAVIFSLDLRFYVVTYYHIVFYL